MEDCEYLIKVVDEVVIKDMDFKEQESMLVAIRDGNCLTGSNNDYMSISTFLCLQYI